MPLKLVGCGVQECSAFSARRVCSLVDYSAFCNCTGQVCAMHAFTPSVCSTHTHTRARARAHAHTRAHTHTHTHTRTHTRVHARRLDSHTRILAHTHTHTRARARLSHYFYFFGRDCSVAHAKPSTHVRHNSRTLMLPSLRFSWTGGRCRERRGLQELPQR
jgi:hypothetical protein